jgi:hypothetical protein
MTVETQSNIVTYLGDGVATEFPYNFPVVDAEHLFVYSRNPLTGELTPIASSGYTVDLDEMSLTLNTAPASDEQLFITRQVPYTQMLDVLNQGGFYPDNVERQLDLIVGQTQQTREELNRAIRVPLGDSIAYLPRFPDRANKYLGFDPSGALMLDALTVSLTNAGVFAVSSRTLLAQVATPIDSQFCFVGETDCYGWFQFIDADVSAQVAADPDQIFYVPPQGEDGTDGAWNRVETNTLNLRFFKPDRTGVSSVVAAFNAAIALANAMASGTSGEDVVGVTIVIPDGRYKIDADLDACAKSGITFVGQSKNGTILELSNTGSAFTWNTDAWGGGLENMTIRYPATPDVNAKVATISDARDQRFFDLGVYNFSTFLELGTDASHQASAIWVSDCDGYAYNGGASTFNCNWGSALFLNNVGFYVNDVPVPVFDRVSVMDTVADTNFLNFTQGGWDTVYAMGSTNCNRYFHGIYVNAPSAVISNLWLNDSIIDFCSDDAVALHAATNATGGIFHVNLGTAYIVSWSGHGVVVTGDNPNAQHDFSHANVYIAGKDAINISGLATRNIKMHGFRTANPNRLVGNYSGIDIGNTLGHYSIQGCSCLSDPSGAFAWSATYGITIAANQNYYEVSGCDMVGSTKNYNIPTDTTISPDRRVHDNLHADYAGYKSTGLYVIPASNSNWINKSPFRTAVWVQNMDLGLGKSDANGNSVDFAPNAAGEFIIDPGEKLFIAYTDPDPTFTRIFFDVLA